MQTKLSEQLADSAQGKKATDIISACVHCGFCLATCPTYQLTGNELDSPRGRIYLIKSALENNQASKNSLQHLDRCLTCRSCETTCPSGVKYSELVGIGRELLENKRSIWQKVARSTVRHVLTNPTLVNFSKAFAQRSAIKTPVIKQQATRGQVLLLTGCVQPALTPNTNHVTRNVLATLGYQVDETPQQACCGAIDHHNAAPTAALAKIKNNIDDWLSSIESGVETIISTASGCGVMVKDYPTLFEPHDAYYQKAVTISEHTQDIAEFLFDQDLSSLPKQKTNIAYHAPCSLQHGQKQPNLVEDLLRKLGYNLSSITDKHLCCGSAGTYSLFEPELSKQLRNNKLSNLTQSQPDLIVTANVGCQLHLSKGTGIPVKHWIELLDV
jgi:glycolate oxidase iron-sulfur subunit